MRDSGTKSNQGEKYIKWEDGWAEWKHGTTGANGEWVEFLGVGSRRFLGRSMEGLGVQSLLTL